MLPAEQKQLSRREGNSEANKITLASENTKRII